MKQHKRRFTKVEFEDAEFVQALQEDDPGNCSSARQAQRKAQQLCRQVQRALNLALEERDSFGGTGSIFVEAVSPAPDCGRLLVHILISPGPSATDAMDAIRRDAARLRAEVARAITRKRAPDLIFVPVCPAGGVDD